MAIALLIASLAAGIATWWREQIKDGHNIKVRHAIQINATLSLIVVLLASANQYYFTKQTAALHAAQLRFSILQELSSYRIEMLDNYWALVMRSAVTGNYASLEAARNSSSGAAVVIESLEAKANESWRAELKESRAAFERLQKISR